MLVFFAPFNILGKIRHCVKEW